MKVCDRFESVGLHLHEVTWSGFVGEVSRLVFDGHQQEMCNTAKRSLRLLSGLERHRVAGWELEMLFGRAVHLSMVRSELLSIFHCCYWYVQNYCAQRAELLETVREDTKASWKIIVLARFSRRGGWGRRTRRWCLSHWVWHQWEQVEFLRRWNLGGGQARADA